MNIAAEESIPGQRSRPFESSGDWRPIPDPSKLTTDAIDAATGKIYKTVEDKIAILRAEMLIRDARFEGMDKASELMREDVNRVPTLLQTEIAHLKELQETQKEDLKELLKEIIQREVKGIGDQITGRDTALAAALKAAQDAVAQQNTANGLAIDKAQAATKEAQTAISELFRTRTDALATVAADLRSRLDRIEAGGIGSATTRLDLRGDMSQHNQSTALIVSIVAAIVGFLSLVSVVIAELARAHP